MPRGAPSEEIRSGHSRSCGGRRSYFCEVDAGGRARWISSVAGRRGCDLDQGQKRRQRQSRASCVKCAIAGRDHNASSKKANVALKSGQEYKAFYPTHEQAIWPEVQNKGPRRADKLVLESPDLDQFDLSIAEVDASCQGTVKGSKKIQCVWYCADRTFYNISKITLKFGGSPDGTKIILPLTLTSYVAQSGNLTQSDSKTYNHTWDRRAPPTFKQTDQSQFPQPRDITVFPAPKADDERARLKQAFKWADFQPTGFYLNPNTTLTVNVSGAMETGSKPQILIGTPALVHPSYHNDLMPVQLQPSQPLNNGKNTVSNAFGGILYVRYSNSAPEASPPLRVTLLGDAAQPFPLSRQGVTTEKDWETMLRITKVPFAEVTGERVIITGLAADAKFYAGQKMSPQELSERYKEIISAQDSISGLNATAPDPKDRPSHLRPMVVQTRNDTDLNSFDYRAAIPAHHHGDVWNKTQLRQSWAVWHELGHHRQHDDTWSWDALDETTVNIYSLASRRLFPSSAACHVSIPPGLTPISTLVYMSKP
ncbi:uncharacterized protein P174DRAFT_425055 [Aspergillus novofumigatus IBT 16806]|uniref:Peptidase M60 domain-containing protein n=1 Tax=Aspergillus novofumigatus (strain IBT 16806) TaxID=1392255 RepID=A0A2I1BWY1_ASPN1|nr:uncharacterized protein P174DRAFT_425055 [Aspergillus novofumigatus IBT 16806]PKX89889.1 hypothetical protein P174DRAFT_425055 [Aspergillus novofumigatus IBT 16806]